MQTFMARESSFKTTDDILHWIILHTDVVSFWSDCNPFQFYYPFRHEKLNSSECFMANASWLIHWKGKFLIGFMTIYDESTGFLGSFRKNQQKISSLKIKWLLIVRENIFILNSIFHIANLCWRMWYINEKVHGGVILWRALKFIALLWSSALTIQQ